MKSFINIITTIVFFLVCSFLQAKTTRPNILWITSEDNSIEWIGCYGSKNAKTPNIDQLANEGLTKRKQSTEFPMATTRDSAVDFPITHNNTKEGSIPNV